MKKINFNKLARAVTQSEGGAQEVNIAQTRQVLDIAFRHMVANHTMSEIVELFERVSMWPEV